VNELNQKSTNRGQIFCTYTVADILANRFWTGKKLGLIISIAVPSKGARIELEAKDRGNNDILLGHRGGGAWARDGAFLRDTGRRGAAAAEAEGRRGREAAVGARPSPADRILVANPRD